MSAKLSSPAVRAGIITLVLLVTTLSLAVPLRSFIRQSDDNAALAAELSERENNIAEMRSELERWKDPAYVEEQARSRLGYVMPGETAYLVVDENGVASGGSLSTTANKAPTESWYERFWASVEDAR